MVHKIYYHFYKKICIRNGYLLNVEIKKDLKCYFPYPKKIALSIVVLAYTKPSNNETFSPGSMRKHRVP
jgi:hypothetical protein